MTPNHPHLPQYIYKVVDQYLAAKDNVKVHLAILEMEVRSYCQTTYINSYEPAQSYQFAESESDRLITFYKNKKKNL